MRFFVKKKTDLEKTPKGIVVRLPETGCARDCVQLVDVGLEFMREIGKENMGSLSKKSKGNGKGKGKNSYFWREAG